MENLGRTYAKLMKNLWRKICSKWCHSGNPLSEAVVGSIFWAKIADNQSEDFLKMLWKNDLPFSWENLRKSYFADLQKTYENITTNLGKILRGFENWVPELLLLVMPPLLQDR